MRATGSETLDGGGRSRGGYGPKKTTRRALTDKQRLRIAYKLGLHKGHPLPRCPVKDHGKIYRLEMMGDFSHSDWYPPPTGARIYTWNMSDRERKKRSEFHFPCEICACMRTAGYGTNHFGWGLCKRHEHKGLYWRHREAIAQLHLESLQQRHPCYYLEAMDMAKELIKRADVKPAIIIADEVNQVKGLLANFYTMCTDYDKNKAIASKNVLEQLQAIETLLKAFPDDSGEEVDGDPQSLERVQELFQEIKTRLTCPLTETTKFGLVPMSDKTRISLIAGTAPKLTKAMKDIVDIMKERWITDNSFDQWLAELLRAFEKEFGEEINYTLMPRDEFLYRKQITDRFLFSILERDQVIMIDRLKDHK